MSNYKSPIGGIVGGNYSWPAKPTGYSSIRFQMTIEKEASAFFWAHQFWFVGGNGGYIGLQTDGSYLGTKRKIAIFSIWEATEAEAVPGGEAQPFGGEGTGFKCVLPINWKENEKYWLKISSSTPTWWEGWLEDGTGFCAKIGKIRVPATWQQLQPQTAFFVEGFGRQDGSLQPCSNVPFTKSLFGCPLMHQDVPPLNSRFETYGQCKDAGADIGRAYKGPDDFSFYAETGTSIQK